MVMPEQEFSGNPSSNPQRSAWYSLANGTGSGLANRHATLAATSVATSARRHRAGEGDIILVDGSERGSFRTRTAGNPARCAGGFRHKSSSAAWEIESIVQPTDETLLFPPARFAFVWPRRAGRRRD